MKFTAFALLSTYVSATPSEILNFKGWMRNYLSGNSTNSSDGASSSGYTDEQCENNLSVTDAYGDTCQWYDDNAESCGLYDDNDFIAAYMCCVCGGGLLGGDCEDQDQVVSDAYGDGCAWYNDNTDQCGVYDDDDFTAAILCCSCGGGLGGNELSYCYDDTSVTDAYGDGCEWYDDNQDSCGSYDDDDFIASSACCSCGGGGLV